MTIDTATWLARYAEALGLTVPTASDQEALLELAGTAAHASERTAAPLSCWLAAVAGRSPADALATAQQLARNIEGED
jgi:hypothetical protein